jgi:HlyD family secretion protein
VRIPRAKQAAAVAGALALCAAAALALRPAPVPVELAQVSRGRLAVTIEDDGRTRVKDRFIVSAPVTGLLRRVTLRTGDRVRAGETLLATIVPAEAPLLDPRARAEAEARAAAAEAAERRAAAEVERARAQFQLESADLVRARDLASRSLIPKSELDAAEAAERTASHVLRAAEFLAEAVAHELEMARAALTRAGAAAEGAAPEAVGILSPVNGVVLRVARESEGVVAAGEEVIEVADPAALEVVVAYLSSDAVKIRPGARAVIEGWGGDRPLEGRVRLVEPGGFTKVSALGIEEQRANVVIDFVEPRERWEALGDGYGVDVGVVIADRPDVLRLPAGALFRRGGEWAAFVVRGGRAALARVEPGAEGGREVEVRSGLAEGDVVIVHPSDRVREGVRVRER